MSSFFVPATLQAATTLDVMATKILATCFGEYSPSWRPENTDTCYSTWIIRADLGVSPGPPPLLWFIKYFRITCSKWNPGICQICASRMHQIASQRTSISKIFKEEHACKPLQESALLAILMGAIVPIMPLYTISLGPLYHKILCPSLEVVAKWFPKEKFNLEGCPEHKKTARKT